MNNPRWFVQSEDGCLYAYFTREILSIDIAIRKGETIKLYELTPGVPGTVKYRPSSVEEFKQVSTQIAKPIKGELTSELVEEDPTLYCVSCNAKKRKDCDCGPIAENN